MDCETEIIHIMKQYGIDWVLTLPCDKVKNLIARIPQNFNHLPLNREEEGVGICAGMTIAGKKPVMLIQNSGIGNMINALCSLTKVYELPLPILISWRGIYKETISAQVPMGKYLPDIFNAIDVPFDIIDDCSKISLVRDAITDAFNNNRIHAILLSPKIWECKTTTSTIKVTSKKRPVILHQRHDNINYNYSRHFTRYQLLKSILPILKGKIVVSNIGITSKELYRLYDQDSNFYMLGSFGLASAIGLGFALGTKKEIFVIDGDGSVLTNPGTLCTIAQENPKNLTILCIDNGVHGATGNQPTPTSSFIDLEDVAESLGIKNTFKASSGIDIKLAINHKSNSPKFIHILANQGNENFPEIPLTPKEIKMRVMSYLKNNYV